jgi:hypothetical protein
LKVETEIKKQAHDLGDLTNTMKELKQQASGLNDQFLSTLEKVRAQNESQRVTSLKVEEIKAGLDKIRHHRE